MAAAAAAASKGDGSAQGARIHLLPLIPLLLLLLLVSASSLSLASPPTAARAGGRDLLAYYAGRAGVAAGAGENKSESATCRGMATKPQCVGRSKWCRWCVSEAVDDACFGFSESRRLPAQVFSCE